MQVVTNKKSVYFWSSETNSGDTDTGNPQRVSRKERVLGLCVLTAEGVGSVPGWGAKITPHKKKKKMRELTILHRCS